ncbi:hypothetical protein O6H91_16G027000 [Diphasiastrum complanatum]|uniref:Uncharacterized protein n=1 Tax=Diphasiastrum complanatum TaxID=34168 RepID=A0ACC2BAS6_DIPCM|nr:hypothetical protein O6H91_16G027000 [Diphasiastrum complanatum]
MFPLPTFLWRPTFSSQPMIKPPRQSSRGYNQRFRISQAPQRVFHPPNRLTTNSYQVICCDNRSPSEILVIKVKHRQTTHRIWEGNSRLWSFRDLNHLKFHLAYIHGRTGCRTSDFHTTTELLIFGIASFPRNYYSM